MTRHMLRLNHERKTSVSIDLRVFCCLTTHKTRPKYSASHHRRLVAVVISRRIRTAWRILEVLYFRQIAIRGRVCGVRLRCGFHHLPVTVSRCFRDLDKQFSLWTPSKLITMRTD